MKSPVDKYQLYARYFPAALAALPILVFFFGLYKNTAFESLMNLVLGVKISGSVALSLVLLYFYSMIIRSAGTRLQESYFTKSKGFPTTYLMLYANEKYSDDFKNRYRRRIKERFDHILSDSDEERLNPKEAQKRLDEITKQVSLFVGDGVRVKDHNIWYGFYRNLMGGFIIAAILSLILSICSYAFLHDALILRIELVLLAGYALVLPFHKTIILQAAESYAHQLISEFLAKS